MCIHIDMRSGRIVKSGEYSMYVCDCSVLTVLPLSSQVLWPFLLEFVKSAEYMEAFGILTRCISHIGGKKRESGDEDYFINFEEQGSLQEGLCAGMGDYST